METAATAVLLCSANEEYGARMTLRRSQLISATVLLASLVLVAMPPAAATSASTRSMTIVTRDRYVSRLGSFRPTEDPRMSAAIEVFGRPSSRVLNGNSCRVDWRRLQLRIYFANFGGRRPGQTTCTSTVGRKRSSRAARASGPRRACA